MDFDPFIVQLLLFIKKLSTRYILLEDLNTNGQVIIFQLRSLDFKEGKLKN